MVQIVHMLWHFLEEIWQIQSDPSGVQWKPACLFRSVRVSLLWVYRRRAWSGSRPHQRSIPPDRGAFLQQTGRGEQCQWGPCDPARPDPNLHRAEPGLTRGGEDPADDAAQPHEELPQRHVLLTDCHHQRAGVVLDEDPRDAMASCCVVYHPLLRGRGGRGAGEWSEASYSGRKNKWVHLTRSVTENWCVSADIL